MTAICAGCGLPLTGREPVVKRSGEWVHADFVCLERFVDRLLGPVDLEPDTLDMIDEAEEREHAWELSSSGDWRS